MLQSTIINFIPIIKFTKTTLVYSVKQLKFCARNVEFCLSSNQLAQNTTTAQGKTNLNCRIFSVKCKLVTYLKYIQLMCSVYQLTSLNTVTD